jgi:hypothetical protein
MNNRQGWSWGSCVSVLTALAVLRAAQAQANPNQFGGQDRANAVSQMVVLAVQQGISSLPPTSGTSFVYRYETDSFVREKHLGPTAFRAPETIDQGDLDLRLGMSYFDLSQTFSPIQYFVQFDRPYQGAQAGIVGFGADVDAKVTVLNLSVSYGVTHRTEVMLNLPVTIVDVQASQISSTSVGHADLPPSAALVDGVFQEQPLSSDPTVRNAQIKGLSQEFQNRAGPQCNLGADACLTFRRDSFGSLDFAFNDGTHPGVGRISLGVKQLLYFGDWFRLAFVTEFFMPSPNQAEFAGSDTASILPRAVAVAPIAPWLRFYTDVGYDYDFSDSDLRRLTWDSGASFPVNRFSFDLGLGGSKYDTPIRWTPSTAGGSADAQLGIPASTLSVLGNNQLGDNLVDVLVGAKLQLTDAWILNGVVTVPVNNEGLQPAALGTLALEYTFKGLLEHAP